VEAAATKCQILIFAHTYELTCDMTEVKFNSRGEFALKGVGRVALWEVDCDGRGPRLTAELWDGALQAYEEFVRQKGLSKEITAGKLGIIRV
jgi:hypothetical protein